MAKIIFAAIRDYVMALPQTPILGVDIHSFANMLLYPYGYKAKTFPDNIDEIRELGERAAKKITGMKAVAAADLGYPASGAVDDWMRGKACIRFVYTFELPGFDQEFHPDEKHIYPTAVQTRDSINVMLEHMLGLDKADKSGRRQKKWCDMSGNGANVPIGVGPAL